MTGPLPGRILETARLILTPVAVSDLDDLQAKWRDPNFTRFITGRALSREEVWSRVLRDIGHWEALGQGNWSMRLKGTGAYVGSVGVLDLQRDVTPAFDAPELGWGIGSAFHGQGLAREGLDAALAWADARPMPRTVCMIAPDNAQSLRLAERVGYRPYSTGAYKDQPSILLERRP
ncbi:GNAT family N-acetyltransferase [soil metagenome]